MWNFRLARSDTSSNHPMNEPRWREEKFLIASGGISLTMVRFGFTYRGLGMWKTSRGSPKGRRPPTWSLTHLGTGHRVCLIHCHMVEAFGVATEMAECGDWDFDSLVGWKDRDPDLPMKCVAIIERHGKKVERLDCQNNHDAARAVVEGRSSLT